jgi:hypothetical protein
LEHVEGAELIWKILESTQEPGEPAGLAAFFASLPQSEAATLSQLLAKEGLNEQMGYVYWTEWVSDELQRRKRQIASVIQLKGDDPGAQEQAKEELKEVLDLESRFTDISRLPSRAP